MAALTGTATRDDVLGPYTISTGSPVDWIVNGSTTIRKNGGGSQIVRGGTANEVSSPYASVSWTGGTPTASGSTDAVNRHSANSGRCWQSWTFPADTSERVVRAYVGGYHRESGSAGPITITATLSDGSAGPWSPTLTEFPDGVHRFWDGWVELTYTAGSAGQTLTIEVSTGSGGSQARNAYVQSAAIVSVTEPLTPPTGLDGEGTSASEIEASWNTEIGDDSYDVRFRSTHTLPSVTTQDSGVPWHLERIYQRTTSATGEYEYRYTGAGVRVYVFDTGVRATHNQLSGKVVTGANFTDAPNTSDEYGHGTQVAGCIAASLVGVAKGATLVPVKLWRTGFDDPPTDDADFYDDYLASLAWILSDAAASGVRCVVNHSGLDPTDITSGEEDAIIAAWEALVDAGIVVCIAGGNEGEVLPPLASWGAQGVIRVAACNSSDQFASFSNHGALVDIVAPGENVPAIHNTSDSATGTYSGTSYAAPIVAGICAMLLEENPHASPARIYELLTQQATPGALTSVPANTVNLLAFTGATSTDWTTRTDVAEPYTIGDGEPDQEYEIAVRRTVDAQTSEWSTGVLAETLGAAPIELEAGGTASASASGVLTTAIAMAGASIVASTSTGSLTTGIKLAGAAASVTLADGALTAQIRLQGAALASAIAVAGLTNAIRLAASAQGGAQASGDLTTQAAGAALAGDATAQALAAGSITAIIRFEAAAVAKAIAEGALATGISMAGAANIAALASGSVSTQVRMAGAAVASALASGDLSGAAQFAGDAIGQALSAGDLSTAVRLAAAAVGGATASGALSTTPAGLAASATALAIAEGGLTTAVRLQGAAASVVQATGTLDVAITFEAQAFAQAMAAGALSTQVRFDAAAVAGALAAADLAGGIPVVPPAERTIPVRAQSRVIAVVPQERVIPVRAQTRLIPA